MRTLFLALALAIPASLAYTMIPFPGTGTGLDSRVAPGHDCPVPVVETEAVTEPDPVAEPPKVYKNLRRT